MRITKVLFSRNKADNAKLTVSLMQESNFYLVVDAKNKKDIGSVFLRVNKEIVFCMMSHYFIDGERYGGYTSPVTFESLEMSDDDYKLIKIRGFTLRTVYGKRP